MAHGAYGKCQVAVYEKALRKRDGIPYWKFVAAVGDRYSAHGRTVAYGNAKLGNEYYNPSPWHGAIAVDSGWEILRVSDELETLIRLAPHCYAVLRKGGHHVNMIPHVLCEYISHIPKRRVARFRTIKNLGTFGWSQRDTVHCLLSGLGLPLYEVSDKQPWPSRAGDLTPVKITDRRTMRVMEPPG